MLDYKKLNFIVEKWQFLKWQPTAVLDLSYTCLDHT